VTIGGGAVLDPHPPRGAIRTAAGVERMRRLDGNIDSVVAAFVEACAGSGLERQALVSRAGLSPAEAQVVVERMERAGQVVPVDGVLVARRVLEELSARLIAELEPYHRAQPLSEGLPREEARERVFRRASPAVFDAVIGQLVAAGRVVGRDRLALAGHQVSLSPEESRVRTRLEEIFRDAKLAPPDASTAAAAAGTSKETAERVLKLLLRTRTLIKLDVLHFHAGALEQLKADVRALKARPEARVDVASFKERYGISRKFAIPLLEYLDRERITRRVGDSRVVL
jgi:selenocysteine-specific elongation factor